MDSRRRLVSYLLINVLVSALVTGTIIFIYDLAHRGDCTDCLPGAADATPGTGSLDVSISTINGAGSLADEQVIIENNGSEALILTDWYLEDTRGLTYTFSQVTLYPGGSVQVHTKKGTNKLPNLYWDRSAPVWQSGELAALYDAQNIARAFYRVP